VCVGARMSVGWENGVGHRYKWRRPLDDVRVAWGGRARRHRVVVDVVMAKNIRLIITRW